MTRWRILAIVTATCAAVAVVALRADAEDLARALERPILHEDVRSPDSVARPGQPRGSKPIIGPTPRDGQNPSAFKRGDKIIPEPPDAKKSPDEPVHGRGGFAADRDTETRPDYHTGQDGTLHYVTVFNPSIIPFKRMSAMDTVRDDYTLLSHDRSLVDVAVGGSQSAGRDLFWGSLVIELKRGVDVPIPSVSPDMRFLSYEIKPRVRVTFSKDRADNFYVRSDETGVSGTYRLVFLVDASAAHFAATVPRGYRVRDVTRKAADLVRPLPARVRAAGKRALAALGLSPSTPLDEAMDKLVSYFRSFEAKASPLSSGDIFWDLFASQAGVCRHRAFAFMVVANTLGIPTRYVANEAHAWVEVWLPRLTWIRIDLGGAALRMEVTNAKNKSIYRPRQEDGFPKPPGYANNYTQLEGDVRGLSDAQRNEARTPVADPDGDDDDDDDGSGSGSRSGSGGVGPGRHIPTAPASASAGRRRTHITTTTSDRMGFRGEELRVGGRLVDTAGQGVGNQSVAIFLAPAGSGGDNAILVGHAITRPDGTYDAEVELPSELELRVYELYTATSGDATFGPAVSD